MWALGILPASHSQAPASASQCNPIKLLLATALTSVRQAWEPRSSSIYTTDGDGAAILFVTRSFVPDIDGPKRGLWRPHTRANRQFRSRERNRHDSTVGKNRALH